MRITKRAFEAAVEAAVRDRLLSEPITYRNLVVDFEARTFSLDGSTHTVQHPRLSIPLLSTERALFSRDGVL